MSSGKSTLSIHPELVIIRDIRLAAQFLNVVILIVVASIRPNNHIQLYIMDGHSKHFWNVAPIILENIFTNNKCFQWIFHDHVPFSLPHPLLLDRMSGGLLQYCTLGPLLPWPTWFVVTLLSNIYKAAITVVIYFRYILSMIYILI